MVIQRKDTRRYVIYNSYRERWWRGPASLLDCWVEEEEKATVMTQEKGEDTLKWLRAVMHPDENQALALISFRPRAGQRRESKVSTEEPSSPYPNTYLIRDSLRNLFFTGERNAFLKWSRNLSMAKIFTNKSKAFSALTELRMDSGASEKFHLIENHGTERERLRSPSESEVPDSNTYILRDPARKVFFTGERDGSWWSVKFGEAKIFRDKPKAWRKLVELREYGVFPDDLYLIENYGTERERVLSPCASDPTYIVRDPAKKVFFASWGNPSEWTRQVLQAKIFRRKRDAYRIIEELTRDRLCSKSDTFDVIKNHGREDEQVLGSSQEPYAVILFDPRDGFFWTGRGHAWTNDPGEAHVFTDPEDALRDTEKFPNATLVPKSDIQNSETTALWWEQIRQALKARIGAGEDRTPKEPKLGGFGQLFLTKEGDWTKNPKKALIFKDFEEVKRAWNKAWEQVPCTTCKHDGTWTIQCSAKHLSEVKKSPVKEQEEKIINDLTEELLSAKDDEFKYVIYSPLVEIYYTGEEKGPWSTLKWKAKKFTSREEAWKIWKELKKSKGLKVIGVRGREEEGPGPSSDTFIIIDPSNRLYWVKKDATWNFSSDRTQAQVFNREEDAINVIRNFPYSKNLHLIKNPGWEDAAEYLPDLDEPFRKRCAAGGKSLQYDSKCCKCGEPSTWLANVEMFQDGVRVLCAFCDDCVHKDPYNMPKAWPYPLPVPLTSPTPVSLQVPLKHPLNDTYVIRDKRRKEYWTGDGPEPWNSDLKRARVYTSKEDAVGILKSFLSTTNLCVVKNPDKVSDENPKEPPPGEKPFVDILHVPEKEPLHLYFHFEGNAKRFPCYLILDCEKKTLSCKALYQDPYRRLGPDEKTSLIYSIPCLLPEAANKLMEDALPLAKQIIKGYDPERKAVNLVKAWTPPITEKLTTQEARSANRSLALLCSEVSRMCPPEERVRLINAEYYLKTKAGLSGSELSGQGDQKSVERVCNLLEIDLNTTAAELRRIADLEQEKANKQGIILVGLLGYFRDLRDLLIGTKGPPTDLRQQLQSAMRGSRRHKIAVRLGVKRHLVTAAVAYVRSFHGGHVEDHPATMGTKSLHVIRGFSDRPRRVKFEIHLKLT